jgi:hypothetical protein
MRKFVILGAGLATLAGCLPGPVVPPETSLPVFGTGYRYEGDPCLRVGEDAHTNQYLDHTADLIACPTGTTPPERAQALETNGDYTLYTVPEL